MSFKLFEKSERIAESRPAVSIWRNGYIAINAAAVREFKLNKSKYVLIYYDKSSKICGLRFLIEWQKNAFALLREKHCLKLNAKKFIEFLTIKDVLAKRYELLWDDNHNFYTFNLNKYIGE